MPTIFDGMPDRPITVGDRILHLMKKNNIHTYKQLADMTGLSPGTISLAVRKGHRFTKETLYYLSIHLKTSVDYLIAGHRPIGGEICHKPGCGLLASWAVVRANQHASSACICCDQDVTHFLGRDKSSTVFPLHMFRSTHTDESYVTVEQLKDHVNMGFNR